MDNSAVAEWNSHYICSRALNLVSIVLADRSALCHEAGKAGRCNNIESDTLEEDRIKATANAGKMTLPKTPKKSYTTRGSSRRSSLRNY